MQLIFPIIILGLYFVENREIVKLNLHLIIKNDKKPSEMTLRDFDSLLVLPENLDWTTSKDRVYYVDENSGMFFFLRTCVP